MCEGEVEIQCRILKEREFLGGLGVDCRIILRRVLKKCDSWMWNGFFWLIIIPCGFLLQA
jgi:hypothetical protein